MTVFFVCITAQLCPQIISDRAPLPGGAGVSVTKTSLSAGETFGMTIAFDVANPLVDLQVAGSFVLNGVNSSLFGVNFSTYLAKGARVATAQVNIDKSLQTGDFTLREVRVSGAVSREVIGVTPITIHVEALPKPLPEPEILPNRATVDLNLTQRQFIKTQAEPLTALRDSLLLRLSKDAADTPDLRDQLISVVQDADDLLPPAQRKYISLYDQAPALQPLLFEDFHRSYQAALIELRAHRSAELRVPIPAPVLQRVQLIQHGKTPPSAPDDWKNHSLAGTYPLVAVAVLELLDRNIKAYLLIADSGLDTFSVRLASVPSGAAISYKRIGEEYTYLSKPTDLPSVVFPYAMWTFRFEKEGCRSVERKPDPYIEKGIDLTVELSCKGK